MSTVLLKCCLLIVAFLFGDLFFLRSNDDDLPESMKRGEEVYLGNCMSCHMYSGEGLYGTYPPLANTSYMSDDPQRSINIILQGQKEEVIINDTIYYSEMPAQDYLTDEQIADVLNYVMNSWGNKAPILTSDLVKTERNKMSNENKD